jgi:hypothetical protein
VSTRTVAETPAEMVNRAAGTITDAARGQQNAEPDHRDMYSLALAVERALDALFAVNGNLGGQLAHYGTDRRLRTDTDRGPAEVLAAAMGYGQTLDVALRQARGAAHSMAGEFARLAELPGPDDLASDEHR